MSQDVYHLIYKRKEKKKNGIYKTFEEVVLVFFLNIFWNIKETEVDSRRFFNVSKLVISSSDVMRLFFTQKPQKKTIRINLLGGNAFIVMHSLKENRNSDKFNL